MAVEGNSGLQPSDFLVDAECRGFNRIFRHETGALANWLGFEQQRVEQSGAASCREKLRAAGRARAEVRRRDASRSGETLAPAASHGSPAVRRRAALGDPLRRDPAVG